MAWYFYSGSVVRPIPVKPGLSKSVRPQSKIEILEVTAEVQALIRKGQLKITGKPKGSGSVADERVPSKDIAAVVQRSPMSLAIEEHGVASGAQPYVPKPVAEDVVVKSAPVEKKIDEPVQPDEPVSEEQPVADDENDEDAEDDSSESVEEIDQAESLGNDGRKIRRKRRR